MRFYVPQFIDIEDKVFGPLSFRQFAYLVGGAGFSYLLFRFLHIFIAVPLIVCVVAFTVALAFYQVNNKPFLHILQSALRFFSRTRLYIWKKEEKVITQRRERGAREESNDNLSVFIPKLSDSKLKELSWSLGVKDSIYASRDPHMRDDSVKPEKHEMNLHLNDKFETQDLAPQKEAPTYSSNRQSGSIDLGSDNIETNGPEVKRSLHLNYNR